MKTVLSVGCSYCGAKKGEPCILTLSERKEPLSIKWSHPTRERATE